MSNFLAVYMNIVQVQLQNQRLRVRIFNLDKIDERISL